MQFLRFIKKKVSGLGVYRESENQVILRSLNVHFIFLIHIKIIKSQSFDLCIKIDDVTA